MIVSKLYDHIREGNLQQCQDWLDLRPQDLNADISEGYVPLHVASMFGQFAVLEFLLGRLALHAANASAATPLHLAVGFRDEAGAVKMVEALVQHGAELNAKQSGGLTPLHLAVGRFSTLLVESLIMLGADPFQVKDDRGRSVADQARGLLLEQSGPEIRKLLQKAFSLPLE
jgi:ankyrin repeat protein